MKLVKKVVTPLLIAAVMLTAAPVKQASAAILCFPLAFLMILVDPYMDVFTFLILDADGHVNQNAVEQMIAKKYSFIDDQDVVRDLAAKITAKAEQTQLVDNKKMVSLSREEILASLAPTSLEITNPEAVEQMINDLK